MKMHALYSGTIRMKKRVFFPDADRADLIDLPISSFLLRHPQGNVLFDTGCHPSVADDPEARWGDLTKAMTPMMGSGENVLDQLDNVGLSPDDIDVVINSHLHCDHCGCNEFFSNATFFVHADELAHASDPAQEGAGYFRADWDHAVAFETFTGERDLFDDERVVFVPLPGHSPGTTGVMANLDRSGSFLLVSDAVSVRANLDQGILPKNTWNFDLMASSIDEIKRIEKAGATIVCGHDPDQWRQMKKGRDAYD